MGDIILYLIDHGTHPIDRERNTKIWREKSLVGGIQLSRQEVIDCTLKVEPEGLPYIGLWEIIHNARIKARVCGSRGWSVGR